MYFATTDTLLFTIFGSSVSACPLLRTTSFSCFYFLVHLVTSFFSDPDSTGAVCCCANLCAEQNIVADLGGLHLRGKPPSYWHMPRAVVWLVRCLWFLSPSLYLYPSFSSSLPSLSSVPESRLAPPFFSKRTALPTRAITTQPCASHFFSFRRPNLNFRESWIPPTITFLYFLLWPRGSYKIRILIQKTRYKNHQDLSPLELHLICS
jgi:hypothetical protein